jgi:PD-(D/E)XK nuclease superfamily
VRRRSAHDRDDRGGARIAAGSLDLRRRQLLPASLAVVGVVVPVAAAASAPERPWTMSLDFFAADHSYTLDGVRVPSVTGVLHRAGLADFSNVPPSILAAALERGRVVHQAIHYWNERDLDVADFDRQFPECAPYLHGWINFTEQRRFVPVINERRIASRRHQVAGTLDCLGTLDGTAVLLDFKTGRPQDVAADLQTAAYHALAAEWAEDDPDIARFLSTHPVLRRFAVQLRKDATFRIEAYADPRDFRDFLTLVAAQQIVARRGRTEVAA